MAGTTSRVVTQRGIALAVLLVGGLLSLPVVAAFLDGGSGEGWIVPVQLVLMAAAGAVVGHLLPGLASSESTGGRSMGSGALVGVAMGLLGVLLFYVLL